jgi:amidase
VSRDGIIPISHRQDTAGPMTRTVADAAVLLAAMAGADARDAATSGARPADYTRFLDPKRLAGARLGVVRKMFGQNDAVNAVMERSLALLKAQGAVLVDPVELPGVDKYQEAELELLLTEMKAGLPKYLAEFAPGAPVRTLADVIEWNRRHAEREMGWFGQDLFERAEATGGLDSKGYLEQVATCRRYARDEGIDAALAQHKLDALVCSTGSPAWLSDPIYGDHSGDSFSSPAAVAGYPHITVPAGLVQGLPVGLSFVGPAFSEAVLIGLAHAFEQASRARRAPTFAKTLTPKL